MTVVVLSGGGGKGAYQVGVWKALRKLKIKYDAVIGTSIGAINAAFMASNDYKSCYRLWRNLFYTDVFENDFDKKISQKRLLMSYAKKALSGGYKLDNLKETLNKNFNINKFYKSNIDFGLITVKLPLFKTCFIKKDEIDKTSLYDYLIASSSVFPIFEVKDINNSYYLDGCYKENFPLKYALDGNYDEIIAVDVRMLKIKNYDIQNKKVIYITPNNKINNFFTMEKKQARKTIKFGYLDTLKKYNYYEGCKYTFKKNFLDKNYDKYTDDFYELLNLYLPKNKYKFYEKMNKKKLFNQVLEKLASYLNLKEDRVYNKFTFNFLLKIKLHIYNKKSNDKRVKIVLKIYNLLSKYNKNNKTLSRFAYLYPKQFLCAIYLKVINKGK